MRRELLLRYGSALAATALAWLTTALLWPSLEPVSFELFLAAVVLTAWWAGLGPALLATLLSVLVIDYFFVAPIYEINFHPGNALRLLVFAGVSLLIVGLTQAERRARARADAASRAKDRMLAVVSHDLRGPLNAVVGWVHVLRRKVKDPSSERALDVIERSADAQRQLIEDLLDFVRIEAGALRIDPRAVDADEIVRASVEAVRPAAEAKLIALEVSTDDGPHVVWADPGRLQQATGNLLANALRFTPESGRVAVRVAGQVGTVAIQVQDSGPGLPADMLSELFPALETTSARPGARGDGLGLGLAIARRIVELHGGTIVADSPGGRDDGALFTISLPAVPRAAAARAHRPVA
jgi:signal transduction histidine kinase